MTIDDNEITNEKAEAVSLTSSSDKALERLDDVKSVDELKDIVNLFSVSIMKKSMSRASVQSDLLDDILEKVKDRVINHHDEMSNKDLLDYMNAIQSGLDYSKKTFAGVDETPPITINNTHNEVKIDSASATGLNRESRERVMNAVQKLLTKMNEDNANVGELLDKSIDEARGEIVNVDERNDNV